MQQLCGLCASLELESQTFLDISSQPHGQQPQSRLLRHDSLAAFKKAEKCCLCQLIAYCVEDTRQEWQKRRIGDAEIQCRVRLMPYRWPTPRPFPVLDVSTQFSFHGSSYGIQLLPAGADDLGHCLVGRLGSTSEIPAGVLQRWLQTCVDSHGNLCESSEPSRYHEITDSMLLIDVVEECLVKAPARPKYVALSYVWGKKQPVLLQTQNMASFQEPRGMANILHELPQTIQDAMMLTLKIGYKFLWVDSLCIVQDDDAFKAKIISRMNLVYSNAFLTIFAASGSDANAGLPGVGKLRQDLEQRVARVGNGLALVYPRSHQNLAKSIWATRGWTYQEYYFSKRKLIFTEDTVFFHCTKHSWRDDVILEPFHSVPQQFDLSRGINSGQDIWEQPRTYDGSGKIRSRYWGSVRAYKKRKLTYESDKLNAFAGILDDVRAHHGMETFWGVPESTLVMDLFWHAAMFSGRRDDFPSWSWLGWEESDFFPVQDDDDLRLVSSWPSVFDVAHSEPGKLSLRKIAAARQENHDDNSLKKAPNPTTEPTCSVEKSSGDSGHLTRAAEEYRNKEGGKDCQNLTKVLGMVDELSVIMQGTHFDEMQGPSRKLLRRKAEVMVQEMQGHAFLNKAQNPAADSASNVGKLLKDLALASKQHRNKGEEAYAESPVIRQLLQDLALAVQNAGPDPVQKALAAILKPSKFVPRALYMPTLTAEIWISACAPNGQIVWARPSPASHPEITYRPTLYAYAATEPSLKPLGLVWLQTSDAYCDVLRRSSAAKPTKLQSGMNPGNTEPVSFVGDPAKFMFHEERVMAGTNLAKSESSGGNTPSATAQSQSHCQASSSSSSSSSSRQGDSQNVSLSAAAANLKQKLLNIGRADDFTWESLCCLPSDESHRSAILASRRIKKLRIAIISGPAHGTRDRFGVPFAYPLRKRRFFRALVLLDQKAKVRGQTGLCSERTGTCEIELDALEGLEEAKFEDVLLV